MLTIFCSLGAVWVNKAAGGCFCFWAKTSDELLSIMGPAICGNGPVFDRGGFSVILSPERSKLAVCNMMDAEGYRVELPEDFDRDFFRLT